MGVLCLILTDSQQQLAVASARGPAVVVQTVFITGSRCTSVLNVYFRDTVPRRRHLFAGVVLSHRSCIRRSVTKV